MLRARGPRRKELLSRVSADLDELNLTYGNLAHGGHVNVFIPCICEHCQSKIDPRHFKLDDVIGRRNDPSSKSTMECPPCGCDVEVHRLLDGIDLRSHPEPDDRVEDIRELAEQRIVIEHTGAVTTTEPATVEPAKRARSSIWPIVITASVVLTILGVGISIGVAINYFQSPTQADPAGPSIELDEGITD